MKYINKLLAELRQKDIEIKPCTSDDLELLKKKADNNKLPEAYLEFMQAMGRGTHGRFLAGIHCFIDDVLDVSEGARELLEENNCDFSLKDTDFVFFMSQGCDFAFFNVNEGENPPVYYVREADCHIRIKKIAYTFTEFLHNLLDINPFMFREVTPRTEEDAIEIHKGLRKFRSDGNEIKDINIVAGVDFRVFDNENKQYCICMISLINYKTNEFIGFNEKIYEIPNINTILGLEFWQIQLFLLAHTTIYKNFKVTPDLYMFHNSQITDENQLDTATFAGILEGRKPTIGVFTNGKEITVSKGNAINSEMALEIVKKMTATGDQVPIPLRYADRLAEELKKKILAKI